MFVTIYFEKAIIIHNVLIVIYRGQATSVIMILKCEFAVLIMVVFLRLRIIQTLISTGNSPPQHYTYKNRFKSVSGYWLS